MQVCLAAVQIAAVCGLRRDSEMSKATMVLRPERSMDRPLDSLELFLPMTADDYYDYHRYFERTSRLFWPNGKVVVLMDAEEGEDHDLALNISSSRHGQVRVAFNANATSMLEEDRQQLRMFQADTWTSSKYIGFIDTGAVFTTPVVDESLFGQGKPIVIGKVGKPEGDFWSGVPKSTEWALGSQEIMRCTSLPLVVKREHLIEMRSWIEERHNATFEAFFDMLIEHRPYSQSNMLCQWLYLFKHDEYSWRIQHTDPESSKQYHVEGQVDEKAIQFFLSYEDTKPHVRVAQHARYDNISSDYDVAKAMAAGVCNANGQTGCNSHFVGTKRQPIGTLHDQLFVFEGDPWLQDERGCLEAQSLHYKHVTERAFSFSSSDQQEVLRWMNNEIQEERRQRKQRRQRRQSRQSSTATSMLPKLGRLRARDPSSGSAATSGKPFQMTKIRTYEGDLPHAPNGTVGVAEGKCNSSKWAVVTTIFDVTNAVKQLDLMPDWCTVVVADKKSVPSAQEWFPEGHRVIYLTVQEQESLEFRSVGETPWNHFSRKNIGFLYAIREGAEAVLDFDDDNDIVMPVTSYAMLSPVGGRDVRARSVHHPGALNVYNYFRPSDHVWPRGLPLAETIQSLSTRRASRVKVQRSQVAVWQHLAQLDPDVDAIWRQTHKLPLKFGKHDDPLVLEKGSWAPFNAQATVWTKAGFLLMRLPSTVHGRVSDIWRSYIAQPLLWNQNLSVAFAAPQFSVANRNAHNYLGDFEAEINLYRQAGALMDHIVAMAGREPDLEGHDALFKVYVELYEHGILEIEDVNAVKVWIQDLRGLGI